MWCTFRDRLLLGAARSYINFLLVNAVAYCATLTKEATEQQQQLFEAGSADRCQSLVISDGDKHLVLHLRFNHIVQASFSESTSRLQCLSPLMSTHFWSLINWLRDKPMPATSPHLHGATQCVGCQESAQSAHCCGLLDYHAAASKPVQQTDTFD